MSTFKEKFDHLRGADIPTVADTLTKFTREFARPVPVVYRAIVNEMLTTSHLSVVCAMWRYDALFALGFEHIFSEFLQYYPDEAERAHLRACVASALGVDADVAASDADAIRAWATGKTPADVLAATASDEAGPAPEALRACKAAADFEWYYSRLFGIGLIALMQMVGEDVDVAAAERWADALGLEKTKFAAEMGAYVSNMERLKMAEQIFAEAAAREAKKTAERLAKRAEAAAKKLEELEAEGPGGSVTGSGGESEEATVATASAVSIGEQNSS